jgi:hypothetical protein
MNMNDFLRDPFVRGSSEGGANKPQGDYKHALMKKILSESVPSQARRFHDF